MNASLAREMIIAGVVVVFSLVVQFILIPSQIEQTVEYELASLSPAFFRKRHYDHRRACHLLLLNHLWHLVKGSPTEPVDDEPLTLAEELRIAAVMVVSIIYYFVLDYLGFWITNTVGVTILLMIQDRGRIWRQITIAAATTVCIYLFFFFVMKVHFPLGKIFK